MTSERPRPRVRHNLRGTGRYAALLLRAAAVGVKHVAVAILKMRATLVMISRADAFPELAHARLIVLQCPAEVAKVLRVAARLGVIPDRVVEMWVACRERCQGREIGRPGGEQNGQHQTVGVVRCGYSERRAAAGGRLLELMPRVVR